MLDLNFDPGAKSYKFEQVRDEILRKITNGHFAINSRLPSITEVCEQYSLSRVTVERAYLHLKNKGYITQVVGKGFFVTKPEPGKLKVLLVFNKLSYYKKVIYYGILAVLKDYARVDLSIHHYDAKILDEIISENLNKYDYFVIMPHFDYKADVEEYVIPIKKIPRKSLIFIDHEVTGLINRPRSVYQDYDNDIYEALVSLSNLAGKYRHFKLVLPSYSNHPLGILTGVQRFCEKFGKVFSLLETMDDEELKAGTAYIIIEELELAELIKGIKNSSYKLGTDIGIVSFNETVLKELLEITVVSTDFEKMGRRVGELIKNGEYVNVHNPFDVMRRKSF